MSQSVKAEALTALLKAVPYPEQQAADGLDLLRRQGALEEGSNESNMCSKDSLEESVAFLGQSALRASLVASDRLSSDEPLLCQPIEHAG
jgi:hypothetical protein